MKDLVLAAIKSFFECTIFEDSDEFLLINLLSGVFFFLANKSQKAQSIADKIELYEPKSSDCTNIVFMDSKINKIKKEVSFLGAEQSWNHNILLPDGIETAPGEQISHGKNLVKWDRIEPILDLVSLKGKQVLDLSLIHI